MTDATRKASPDIHISKPDSVSGDDECITKIVTTRYEPDVITNNQFKDS